MRLLSNGRLRHQVETLRRQFLQEGGLPFADVLTTEGFEEALREIKATWKDRIYTPLVTLWVFLGQALNADQSCRAAVARLVADRAARGLPPCSSETGAYCQARKRLPEAFFSAVARLVGRNLDGLPLEADRFLDRREADLPLYQLIDDLDHLAQAAAQSRQLADDQAVPRLQLAEQLVDPSLVAALPGGGLRLDEAVDGQPVLPGVIEDGQLLGGQIREPVEILR
jgi:hypothetical protein